MCVFVCVCVCVSVCVCVCLQVCLSTAAWRNYEGDFILTLVYKDSHSSWGVRLSLEKICRMITSWRPFSAKKSVTRFLCMYLRAVRQNYSAFLIIKSSSTVHVGLSNLAFQMTPWRPFFRKKYSIL